MRPTSGDVIAGVSVALLALPQSLAYAELAGLPAEYGLFASALPAIAAAAFVSSRHLQTGPVALTALLTFGALSPLADPLSGEYIALAALLAVLVGLFRVLFGVLRAGSVAYALSEPVLLGFTTAAAILITSSQLPKLLGVTSDEGGVLVNAIRTVVDVGAWQPAAVLVSIAVATIILVGRKLHPLFPGVVVAVVVALVYSRLTGYDGAVVGELSGDFVSPRFDFPWSSAADLVVPALAIALVGFAEPSSIARTFAAQDKERWDPNREFISQGVANLAAGLSGAFPVGGSFSRSSLSRLAGAKSAWAGAITGLTVLVAIPITPILEALPRAVLGAVIVVAVVPLIRFRRIFELFRQSGAQAIVASGTMVATLATAPRVERGVVAGVILAMLAHLYRELSVPVSGEIDDDVLVVRPKGVVWFATVPAVDARLRSLLAEHPDVSSIEVDMSSVGRLDFSGAASLARIAEEVGAAGLDVRFTNLPPTCERAARIHLLEAAVE